MSIGSAPEIGATFGLGVKDFDFTHWRKVVGDDLMGGYGSVHMADPVRVARIHQEWLDNPELGGVRLSL